MNNIIFKTQDAVFKFNQVDVKKMIINNKNHYNIDDTEQLLKLINFDHLKVIEIPEEPAYFDYIALDLMRSGYGTVFCNTCNQTYSAGQLKAVTTGAGKNPLTIQIKKKGVLKRIFSKKRKLPSISGGISYFCPEDHNLISVITWKLF